jgi:hypothetical protein
MSISNSKALLQCTLLAIIVLLFSTNAIAQTINGTASVLDFEKTKGQPKSINSTTQDVNCVYAKNALRENLFKDYRPPDH